MLDRGAFDGVHAALMVHPTPMEDLYPRVSAVAHMRVRYTGRESHAAIAPELGINAADALTVAQVAVGLLRQHLRAFDQVHGIVTHGGDATNVVPAHTEGTWMARSRSLRELEQLRPRVEHCFEAGARATGATLAISDVCPPYAHMEHDHDLAELFRANATAIGRPESHDGEATFSTDMGNVSLAMPSIHPCIAIDTDGAVNHQPEFAQAAVNASADRAVAEGALAMAWTVIDAATGPLRDRLLN
jgi:metal-dependent amidase/aminoacylase/carboxypeptidase family protein